MRRRKTNTGKPSQRAFEAKVATAGKNAYLYRVTDTAEVRGLSKTRGFTKPQPCDYIVVVAGHTFWVEVKSTSSLVGFQFGQIENSQMAAARRVTAAGGHYFFAVHRLKKDLWYLIPATAVINATKRSIAWQEAEAFLWKGSSLQT